MADETRGSDEEKNSRSSHESDLDHFPVDLVNAKSGSGQNLSCEAIKIDGQLNENFAPLSAEATSLSSLKGKENQHDTSPALSKRENASYHKSQNVIRNDSSLSSDNATRDGSHTAKHSKCGSCYMSCQSRCLMCCRPCMTKFNPLPEKPSRCQRLKYVFLCPPHGKIGQWLTSLLAVTFFYGALWGIVGDDALPGGNIFAIFMIFIFCVIGGMLIEKIRLPPLLGDLS